MNQCAEVVISIDQHKYTCIGKINAGFLFEYWRVSMVGANRSKAVLFNIQLTVIPASKLVTRPL